VKQTDQFRRCMDRTATTYGGACGHVTAWLAELLMAIDSSGFDLSFGAVTNVMGALWRRVQKLVVARWRADGGESSIDL
jgi:hypothetical protein